jgi:hypothetical protein
VILLLDILRDDSQFCRIYIENTGKWIDSILTYVNLKNNVAEVFISTRHFRSLISEGSKLIVKSLDSNQEYIFTGTVSKKIVSIRKQSLSIKIDEIVKFDNERIFERFPCNYPAIIKNSKNSNSYSGILVDISSGGILISSPNSFEPNTSLNLEIYFATENPINFVGRVLRRSTNRIGYSYGISIEEIDNNNAIVLNKLIENLVTEKKHIFEELNFFKRMKKYFYASLMLICTLVTVIIVKLSK